MYGKPDVTCFKYTVYLYNCMVQKNSNICMQFLSDYRVRNLSHQTAPTPHYRQPSPPLYGSITFTHLE
jgi:hypothetical protein